MKSFIEKYRGFIIEFDTDNEVFISEINEKGIKGKGSYASLKKEIDDYIKDNGAFQPFWAIIKPGRHAYDNKRIKITGMRKDGRFIFDGKNGEPTQLSTYHEDDYLIEEPQHNNQLGNLAILESKLDKMKKELQEEQGKVTGKLLIDFRKEIFKS